MNSNINLSNKANEVWENHMKSFCSGRESAFELSSELIFSLADNNNINILDIACGYGGWSKFLQNESKKYEIQTNFVGMDESEDRLNLFKDILGDSAKTITGNILNTLKDIENNYFDCAVLGWASHEIPHEQLIQIYSLVRNVLKPNGYFFIADFVQINNPKIEILSKNLTNKRREYILSDPKMLEEENWVKGLNKHKHHNHGHHHNHNEQHRHNKHYSIKEHTEFLNNAGFNTVDEIWKSMNSSMLLAIK